MRDDLVRLPCEVMDSVMSGVDEQSVGNGVQTRTFKIVLNCEDRHFCRVVQEQFLVERLERGMLIDSYSISCFNKLLCCHLSCFQHVACNDNAYVSFLL